MIRSPRRIFALTLIAASFVACEDERPEPISRLDRPAGLAYVSRNEVPGTIQRADLFVADSEAEGVRVIQFRRRSDANDRNEILETDFLASPALFFPLVIPAKGFPTKIALSETNERLYVIAPLSRMLYAVDSREQEFHVSPENDGSRTLLEVPLDMMIDEDAVPVGVAVYPGFDGDDVVLVAFDVLDRAAGVLAAFRFTGGNAALTLVEGSVQSVDIGAAPRDLFLRDGYAVVSSALTDAISVATLSTTGAVIGEVRSIDAGGPTANIIDGKKLGIYVTRVDRSSLILLESTAGLLDRSTRRLTTPFTPFEDRTSSVALGRLDVRDSSIVTGAYGELKKMDIDPDDEQVNDLLEPFITRTSTGIDPAAILALAHLDGRISFFFGDNVKLAAQEEASVSIVTAIEGDVRIPECNSGMIESCTNTTQPDPLCEPDVLLLETIEDQQLRISYQGALASTSLPAHEVVGTSSLAVALRLTDSALTSFSERRVRAGDAVLLAFEVPADCANTSGEWIDLVETTVVTSIDNGEANELDLEVRTSTAVASAGCADQWEIFRYEVYPNTDEVVVALSNGGVDPIGVLERIPVTRDGSSAFVRTSTLVGLTFESPTGFSCRTTELAGEACYVPSDCSDGSACVPTGVCQSRCMSTECMPTASGCSTTLPVRYCSAAEIKVSGTANYTIALGLGAPEDMVFSEQRRAFMVSFPGGREVAEVFTDETGEVGVRHIR